MDLSSQGTAHTHDAQLDDDQDLGLDINAISP